MSIQTPISLVEIAKSRAERTPNKIAYTFVSLDEPESTLTYLQLHEKAAAIAADLQQRNLQGKRALLLYLPGFDYVTAFFGCLYAGVVAVPAYPPDPARLQRTLPRLVNIIKSAQASVIMTTSAIENLANSMFMEEQTGNKLQWVSTDTIARDNHKNWSVFSPSSSALAFLQYTSGSTSAPRGVMLSHENIMDNLTLAETNMRLSAGENPHAVSWLPPYHDMGLIGCIMLPLKEGFPITLMSPLDFLANPFVWLKTVSNKKATAIAGPNFAYDLCVRRISQEEKEGLDLSSIRIAISGAEPVRAETLDAFARAFEHCGFDKRVFCPCYGLAEGTLYVCGNITPGQTPTVLHLDKDKLKDGLIKQTAPLASNSAPFVSCGDAQSGQEAHIVDPISLQELPSDRVGEIWLKHGSVAKGYYNDPQKTEETFCGYISGKKDGPFMRTGDLGFLHKGELFVTGRQKDTIIIRGKNHYPQDIEFTVENCHNEIRPGCIAAFPIEREQSEQLVVVCEIKRQLDDASLNSIAQTITSAVSQNHSVRVSAVTLIQPRSIPKTSSGKIQRHAAKEMFLTDTLDIIFTTNSVVIPGLVPGIQAISDGSGLDSRNESRNGHLVNVVDTIQTAAASILGLVSKQELDVHRALVHYGLDSLMRQELLTSLSTIFNHKLDVSLIDDHTTISSLASVIPGLVPGIQAKSDNSGLDCRNKSDNDNRFGEIPAFKSLDSELSTLHALGLKNPFFVAHDGLAAATTRVHGQTYINFASYNYIGLSGHADINKAAKNAIDQYGTTVSASRLVSGERPIHQELEQAIAAFMGVEDAIVFVSGHATNVSTIGHLFGPKDVIFYDSLSHNSILQGCQLSQSRLIPFPHNDYLALDRIMTEQRHRYERALIVIEGVYSMDGDIANLPKYIELKHKHHTFLMVDEAHSLGVLGKNGKGLSEHFGIDPRLVDIWMGTLSKALVSCGGYIAGSKELVRYLKYTAPGFVYSVGLPPPNTAASLEALRIAKREPERFAQLQANSKQFLDAARSKDLNTGMSAETPVIPVIIGNSMQTLAVAERLFEQGINVRPIIYPAVEDSLSRLRFFITAVHTPEQIHHTVNLTAKEVAKCVSL